ncbi:MAG: rhodanese-like domain-containing protein [Candidatus Ozemobacteraceae bacterium]
MNRFSFTLCALLVFLTPLTTFAANETAATPDPKSETTVAPKTEGCAPDACANCPDAACPSKAGTDMKAVSAADANNANDAAGHENLPLLSTSELADMIASKTTMILIDARSGKFDDGKRIPGAVSLTDQATAEEAAKVINAKDALVVTYCSNLKCPASLKLAMHLKKLGFSNIKKYPEGIEGWVKAGHEVTNK